MRSVADDESFGKTWLNTERLEFVVILRCALLRRIASNVTMTYERKTFVSFTRAGEAEEFEDRNEIATGLPNGVRDAGECYFDENNNGAYDSKATAGIGGQGGARDIVVYSAQAVYPRLFPLYGLVGSPTSQTIKATTVLRNQPFGIQQYVETKNCP